MKILLMCPSEVTKAGGVHKNILRVAEELSRRGHECIILCLSDSDLPEADIINGISIIRLRSAVSSKLLGFVPKLITSMNNIISTIRPDVIHVHEYRSLFTSEVMWLIRKTTIPVVFSPHYDRNGYNTFAGKHFFGLYKKLSQFVFNISDCIVVNSGYTKKIIQDDFVIAPDKLTIIPHGVDIFASKEHIRRSDDCTIRLIYVGVLTKLKGVHFILPALQFLQQRGYKVSLTLVGDGPYKKKIRNESKRLGIENQLCWLGPRYGPELRSLVSSQDILLLLSRGESYGIVVAESLALGTPCLVSRATALIEFLDEPGCIGVDNPADEKEVADAIIRLVSCPVTVGPFSNKIMPWGEVALDYENKYKELISSSY